MEPAEWEDPNYLATRGFVHEKGYFRHDGKIYDKRWKYEEHSDSAYEMNARKQGFTLVLIIYETEEGMLTDVHIREDETDVVLRHDRPKGKRKIMRVLSEMDDETRLFNRLFGTDFRFRTLPGMYELEKKQEADRKRLGLS